MSPQKKRKIESYGHAGKDRANNPPVGLVNPTTDPDKGEKQTYAYDPHLDPQLQWAGKAEHTSFDVPTQSLHVHERIDPRTIMEAVRKRNGNNSQASLFEAERDIPLRQEIEFYKHAHNWSNRLIAGDSLLVMNSLLQKENMAGKVQCVYMDPPYGIKYGSNFQPFVNKRDVKDGRDEDLTAEPETIKAFRDTWELGIHSYLSYMRDRLLLARELLTESGSVFVQISDENVHLIRNLMDEIFGVENFIVTFPMKKKGSQKSGLLDPVNDFLVWYGKSPRITNKIKYRQLYFNRTSSSDALDGFRFVEIDGKDFLIKDLKTPDGKLFNYLNNIDKILTDYPNAKLFRPDPLQSGGVRKNQSLPFECFGKIYHPAKGSCWKTTVSTNDGSVPGMNRLRDKNRLVSVGKGLYYRRYFSDFEYKELSNWWDNLGGASSMVYVVQTNERIIQRCFLMTTDPGDLVFDPTCGSGTTAYVAEQWGRRWITCDTSRVALTLAKQRLMTATFDYYKLAYPNEGVGSGFEYKKVPHITLKSIANNEPPATETLFDQPLKDTKRARVTGPFTTEAVPAPTVQPIDNTTEPEPVTADETVARSGETLRQHEWRDELLKTGIRGKSGQRVTFSRVEPVPCRWLHADAETKPDDSGKDEIRDAATTHIPRRAVISFGPEHAPLEQRQVENALQEATTLMPKPEIVVFAAFQFDPEAAKDIDETNWPGVTMLKAQMNADMQNQDLKKKRASNESFWLVGQPDITIEQIRKGDFTGQWQVQVNGFDYFNTKTGELESGDENKIAVWMLDTDYDGRSLYPSQVFFPMADSKGGWAKLAKNLKAEIDDELIEAYKGSQSLPFERGKNNRIAVKIVDDRGIESLKVVEIVEAKVR